MVSSPRVHDGNDWIDITYDIDDPNISEKPIPPSIGNSDETIFISIPSYRDGKRCGETLKSIYDNASDPTKVYVGIIEQKTPDDTFCIEHYCSLYENEKGKSSNMFTRTSIRKDTTKVIIKDSFVKEDYKQCLYYNQIRFIGIHHYAAKGPSDTRSLTRKLLGNEEYCMTIDSHSKFIKDWDSVVKNEWILTKNEFGIITTVPANSFNETSSKEIPRQCLVSYRGGLIPEYSSPADGKVMNLQKPLLSHGYSSAFAFAKCHLEEVVPYDSFAPYVVGAEQFVHYARLWTRGYDTYTPTQNIVFHNYEKPEHGMDEWNKPRRQRLKQESLQRFNTILQISSKEEDDNDKMNKLAANFGIYGLGKRRSIQQLNNFVNINLQNQIVNSTGFFVWAQAKTRSIFFGFLNSFNTM